MRTLIVVVAATVALAGCGHKKRARVTPPRTPRTPAVVQPGHTEEGIASWYGHPYHGRAAANGEIYDMEKLTAAHRTLPFGTWVRVTNLTNNKTVAVRIIDLSRAAARAIDLIGPGIAQVRVDIIPAPAGSPAQAQYAIQIGVFQDRDRAERSWQSMQQQFGSARIVPQPQAGRPNLWRVLVGAANNLDEANALAEKVRAQAAAAVVVWFKDEQADPAAPRGR